MQHFMYLIILFASGALTLIDADECDTFPNITNALFDDIDDCGIVKIRCRKGFRMVTNATCIGYLWVYKKPFCIPDKCLAEPNITNGDLDTEITSRHIDIEYNYTCRPRFRKNGDGGTLRCDPSGEWVIDVPCEAQCPPEANIPNGDLDTNITARCEGSEYNYTCRPRFLKNGDGGTLRCNASGQWEFDVLCEAQCPAEATIPNADLDTNITSRCAGNEYNYTCRPEFVKNGDGGTLRCNASGQWEIDVLCEDCFKRTKNLEVQCAFLDVPTEADCRQECANNMNCAAQLFISTRQPNCYLCAVPVVGLSLRPSFSGCLSECGQLQSCITVLGADFRSNSILCVSFNDTCEALPSYDNIIERPTFITAPQQTIAEKSVCPSLFGPR